ncbi:hypothetical protein RO3G_10973 [Lichtheimia corymbifera JMRC:FSU:9682]|uniref:Uncharacterized protein n=1 Tax=Lichtheimia corymbifera JMRC:FSU:9682 TaxID=1263082 RepID=A0A068RNK4_9FUNG|nr:hypothetical protein RO3G_10973 [Lichtheimia corymbifera JMRC:FSU:9682]
MSSDNAAVDNVSSPDRYNDSTTEARVDTGSKDTSSSLSTGQTSNDVNGTNSDSPSSPNSNESESSDGEKTSGKRPASDPGYKATSEALVRKLLQLSSPRMDIKIVSVLLHEGVMDIFMSHISRLEEEQDSASSSSPSLSDRINYAGYKRDTDDFEATKRSYHAMELLCGTSANHYWVQDSCFQTIVTHLLDVLSPNSDGNLNHFGKIFQHMVRRHPCDMMNYMILDGDASKFFDILMPYLAHGPITDSILSLLFVYDNNEESRTKRQSSLEMLSSHGFLQWFLDAIQLADHPDFSNAAKDLFLRIVEEASQMDGSAPLFNELMEDAGADIVSFLVKFIKDQAPSRSRQHTINMLKSLATSGSPPTRASSTAQPIQGPLYSICHRVRELLTDHIPALCNIILEDYDSQPSHPLTLSHMAILDIIYSTLSDASDKESTLDSVPDAFWKLYIDLFFEKTTSSIYHTMFYKIFYLLLSTNYEPILSTILQEHDLITRMIQSYSKDKASESRGFVLLILNHLRLKSDADPSGMVHGIMTSHEQYKEFLPTLRSDTLAQTETKYAWKLDTCARPAPHLGPTPPLRFSLMYTSYNAATLPLMGAGEPEPMDDATSSGIDLGSDYAYCLGFDHSARHDGGELQSNYQSRRNSLSGDSCYSSESGDSRPTSPSNHLHHNTTTSNGSFPAGLFFESLTPEEPSSETKKKKKKKKPTSVVFDAE